MPRMFMRIAPVRRRASATAAAWRARLVRSHAEGAGDRRRASRPARREAAGGGTGRSEASEPETSRWRARPGSTVSIAPSRGYALAWGPLFSERAYASVAGVARRAGRAFLTRVSDAVRGNQPGADEVSVDRRSRSVMAHGVPVLVDGEEQLSAAPDFAQECWSQVDRLDAVGSKELRQRRQLGLAPPVRDALIRGQQHRELRIVSEDLAVQFQDERRGERVESG